jgi:hypothetical protein
MEYLQIYLGMVICCRCTPLFIILSIAKIYLNLSQKQSYLIGCFLCIDLTSLCENHVQKLAEQSLFN